MKQLFPLIMAIFCVATLPAQDTIETWTFNGIGQVNISQASFHNWAQGGEDMIAGTGIISLNANADYGNQKWESSLKAAYGRLTIGGVSRKSDDMLDISSKFTLNSNDKVSYGLLFNFLTQFDEGYNYEGDKTLIADFLAPAYLTLSAGIDYKPAEWITIFISPLTAKFTYITDINRINPELYGVDAGEQWRSEMGALVKAELKREVMENVTLNTSLQLFSNYLESPENIDINWELLLGMKVNEYITASISTQLIYDHDILILKQNQLGQDYYGRGTQFKEVIAVGLSYKFL